MAQRPAYLLTGVVAGDGGAEQPLARDRSPARLEAHAEAVHMDDDRPGHVYERFRLYAADGALIADGDATDDLAVVAWRDAPARR